MWWAGGGRGGWLSVLQRPPACTANRAFATHASLDCQQAHATAALRTHTLPHPTCVQTASPMSLPPFPLLPPPQNVKGGKMYIQDKVEEYSDEVFDLLNNGAHIYFCGLKGMMPGGSKPDGNQHHVWKRLTHLLLVLLAQGFLFVRPSFQ